MWNRRGHCRVLVIEADPLSRDALVALLEQLDCTCRAARSYGQAVEILDDQTHVIASVGRADSMGYEVLKLVRARGLPHHLAVMTALEREDELVRAVNQLEPELLLRKPVDVDALLGWLDHSRS
jgi:CheY-like chemotaxis protein